jgi:hypothetical protein
MESLRNDKVIRMTCLMIKKNTLFVLFNIIDQVKKAIEFVFSNMQNRSVVFILIITKRSEK